MTNKRIILVASLFILLFSEFVTAPALQPYLISPTTSLNVTQNQFFTFSAGVRCLSGICGNVTAILDPIQRQRYEFRAPKDKENIGYGSPKIEEEVLRNLDKAEEVPVIIVLENSKSSKNLKALREGVRTNQEHLLSKLNLSGGADFKLKYKYATVNSIAGNLTKKGLEKLKKEPNVVIYLDRVLHITLTESVPLINATSAWTIQVGGKNLTGYGQTVCVVDSGIDYTHPDLGNCTQAQFLSGNCPKVLSGYDYVNNDNNPMDDNDHGTHVAGIVAANGFLKGVAPNAKLVALKVCSSLGSCSGSDMIAGVDWCNSHSEQYNISVITMSIGDDGEYNSSNCPTWMDLSMGTAHSLGILVSVASGNEYHSNGISYPACSPYATSVGSTTKSDEISAFTNTGENLDLLAPGQFINSTIVEGYGYMSGTSMATPHVAGAAALLKQYKNSITPDGIEYYLKSTGKNITDPNNGLTFPRINVLAAVYAIQTGKGVIPMNNGTPFYTISQNPVYPENLSCLANMHAGDSCNQTWQVNATGEHLSTYEFFVIYESSNGNISRNTTSPINVTIIGNFIPEIYQIQCERNNSLWADCSNITYGNELTKVRANCTDPDGAIVNVSFRLKNLPDNMTFFSNFSSVSDGWWLFDNSDVLIQDSGEWNLLVSCIDNKSAQTNRTAEWLIPWGVLQSYLITPLTNINVTQYSFFNFSSGVNCILGECGNVTAILDPEKIMGNSDDIIIFTTEDNANNSGHWIPDYDMDDCIFDNDSNHPIEFYLNSSGMDIPQNFNANLTIYAYDIDWPFEVDEVFLNNHSLGYLTGDDGEWSYTTFAVNRSFINTNYNLVKIVVDLNYSGYYCTYVDWGRLVIQTGKGTIPMNNGTPFYTISQNPVYPENLSCLANMHAGDSCNQTWQVNATGEPINKYSFYTIYNSAYTGVLENRTSRVNVTIVNVSMPPNITACWFNETNVLQGSVVQLNSNITQGTYAFSLVWWNLNGSIWNLTSNNSLTWWTNVNTSNMLGNYTNILGFVNDTANNLDSESCGSLNVYTTTTVVSYHTVVNITANQTKLINATNETNITLEITTSRNVTNATVNISLYNENPTSATFSVPNLGKYLKIDVSSGLNDSLVSAFIKMFYTDEEVNAQGIDETTLSFYWYNASIQDWMRLNNSGVNTTENYVWANVSHFSIFAFGGSSSGNQTQNFTISLSQGWNLISIPLSLMI